MKAEAVVQSVLEVIITLLAFLLFSWQGAVLIFALMYHSNYAINRRYKL